jgi:hypothetical protein
MTLVDALQTQLAESCNVLGFVLLNQIIQQELPSRCALNDKVNNAESRAEFVSEKLSASH